MYFDKVRSRKIFGFTLIELMVVISIISLLSSVLLANLNTARMKARDAERLTATRSVINAFELYYAKYKHYPCSNVIESSSNVFLIDLVNEGFLSQKLSDPINSGGYVYGYISLKASPGGQCGAFALFTYDVEVPGTPCILGGRFMTSTHCHIPYPSELACGDPWLAGDTGSVCSPLFY